MKAQNSLLTEIINNYTLIEVPFFQRAYVWEKDLWQRLLEDMEFMVQSKHPHFMGSVILKEGRDPGNNDSFITCKTVVDGQQRLTTFLIFLKALCLKKGELSTFDTHFKLSDDSVSLLHGKNDVDAFLKVVNMSNAEVITDNPNQSKIIEAFNFFISNLDVNKIDIKPVFTHTQFVKIDLDKNDDEQQIFDSINSLGVTLTTSELLKNYFFSRDTIKEYKENWEDIFEKNEDEKLYWYSEIETGRLKRAIIDLFFDAYFQIFIQDDSYKISNEDKLVYARVENLSKSYQDFINKYCNGNKDVILNGLKKYATSFRKLFNPDLCNVAISAAYGIERMNILIFGLQNTTLIPYILYLDNEIDNDEDKNEIYKFLESFIMRRIISHLSTKNYNNLFTSLILNKITDVNSLKQKLTGGSNVTYMPTDNDLHNGFRYSKLINQQSKAIIYLIENSIRPINSSVALLGFNKYSLEHLMPKKWRNNWQPCISKDMETERDSMLLTLGNLAIITQSLNASIRDASWEDKKKGKNNRPGLTSCAGGLQTLSDALTKPDWSESEISSRADWLYSEAKKIW